MNNPIHSLRQWVVALSLVCLSAAAIAAPKPAVQTAWPWGAKVDESVFAPGGSGVTIHVSPSGARDGDGSAAKPYDLDTALKQAAETVRSMETDYQRLGDAAISPLWLKIARRGNEFATFTARDEDGRPGVWTPAGDPKTIATGRKVYAGFLVTSNQGWPQKDTFAEAAFDRVTVGGRAVADASWLSERVGVVRGVAQTEARNGQVVVKGNGFDSTQKNNPEDSGQFAYVAFEGDGEVVARIARLTPSAHSKSVAAALAVRETLSPGARMVELEVAEKGGNSGIWRGFRADRSEPGRSVRVLLAPGTYRAGMWLPERDEIAQGKVFAVEGAKVDGKTGQVILSGSEEWKPAEWRDEGEGVYSHAWTRNWGGEKLSDRREMVFLTPPGGSMQRLRQVLTAPWKKEPGTFCVDEEKDRLTLRLPEGVDASRWGASLVEVATRDQSLLGFGTMNSRSDDNLILRNLVFQHCAAGTTFQLNWWVEPKSPNRNWLLEDLTFRHNSGEGFRINHLRDFTLRRIHSHDNGTQNHFIGAEGQIVDSVIERNGWRRPVDSFWNALKNVYVANSSFSDNNGNAFRNDHVAENVLIENCRLNGNSGQAVIFETAIGPITLRHCEIKNNNRGGGESDDAAVGLSTVANITFDGVIFENNHRGAIAFYPRERAHTANREGDDELPNNLDVGQWDQGDTPESRWSPGGKKPASENRNFTIMNCTFLADAEDAAFIRQHWYRRNSAYQRNIRQELRAYNNAYFNPRNPRGFQTDAAFWKPHPDDTYVTFDEWKKVGVDPHFEAGSVWGRTAPRNYMPPPLKLARSGRNSAPTRTEAGRLIYEAESTRFVSQGTVTEAETPNASGGKLHKLLVDQVGDYAEWVEYTLTVPEAGDYYVDVGYLQDSGPFSYLGYAQLLVNGQPVGSWWDQHGVTRSMMDVPLGRVRLNAGENSFRFVPVWRNGYGSGDYDITIDRITLSTAPNLLPAVASGPAQNGLHYQLYRGEWTQLPAFDKQQPEETGQAPSFDISFAEEHTSYALRFAGFVTVPADGIYTFATTVNDGANLYIGERLVVDNDGVHDGEKDEPWRKHGSVALKAGRHPIRVDYFNNGTMGKGQYLEVGWSGPGFEYRPLSSAGLGATGPATLVAIGPSLINGATASMPVFRRKIKGNASLEESGTWPQPWSANLWDAGATGEVALEKEPTTQRSAIALRNLEGNPSLQFYTWKGIDLAPGRYEFRFDYLLGGDTAASLSLNLKGMDRREVSLAPTGPEWKRTSVVIEAAGEGVSLSPQFKHMGRGPERTLYLKSISLRRLRE